MIFNPSTPITLPLGLCQGIFLAQFILHIKLSQAQLVLCRSLPYIGMYFFKPSCSSCFSLSQLSFSGFCFVLSWFVCFLLKTSTFHLQAPFSVSILMFPRRPLASSNLLTYYLRYIICFFLGQKGILLKLSGGIAYKIVPRTQQAFNKYLLKVKNKRNDGPPPICYKFMDYSLYLSSMIRKYLVLTQYKHPHVKKVSLVMMSQLCTDLPGA